MNRTPSEKFAASAVPPPRELHRPSLDRDALRQVPRFVDVAAELDGEVVGEELKGDDREDRADEIGDFRIFARRETYADRRRRWSATLSKLLMQHSRTGEREREATHPSS
jgi:hypothetical protein